MWLHLSGEWNDMKWDRLWREMSVLEIAESDTWGEEAFFFSVLEHETLNLCCPFSPLSIFSLIESNTPLRNILITYVNLDMEQRPSNPSPALRKKDLHNFESIFITVFTCDCSKAELKLTITASWIQITSDSFPGSWQSLL